MGRKIKMNKENDGGVSFPDKYAKIPGFSAVMEEFDTYGEADLKKNIIAAEASIEEQEKLMDNDVELKAAKENAKVLSSGYKDAKKYQYAKIKYALFCLEKMGSSVEINTPEPENKDQ